MKLNSYIFKDFFVATRFYNLIGRVRKSLFTWQLIFQIFRNIVLDEWVICFEMALQNRA
ncbi:hypothetical protein [Fulvivirga sp. M361]|uniref:hypothetical protein n=1 Tax=Fulvivirga sp. M361 TaxID=2594266 RepID=UPI0016259C39|nr:hypothetical protein [Fulvivirga sp. M361]